MFGGIRFSEAEVRESHRDARLPLDMSDANLARVGIERLQTQREKVLALYRVDPDVDAIFDGLGGRVPKSSIRAYLSRAAATGEIGSEWRIGRGRRSRQ